MGRSAQHEHRCLCDILGPQTLARRDLLVDAPRIRVAPQFIENGRRSDRAYTNLILDNLSTNSIEERVQCVLRRAVDWLEMNRLISRNGTRDENISTSVGPHMGNNPIDGAENRTNV